MERPGTSVPGPVRGRRGPLPLVAAALAATVLAVLPLIYLALRATQDGWATVGDTLWRTSMAERTLRTVELAAIVTVGCLVLGVGLAWLVARTDLPGRRVLRVLVGLPLALPSYVAAVGWIGRRPDLAGRTGAVVVLVTISYPYVYLPVTAALRRCDPALEDAARSLGHGSWSVFWRVTLPQVRIAAAAGALLVGLYALSDFGAVATMRYDVLTRSIYQSYRGSSDWTPAAILGCVLAVLAVVVVMVEGRLRRRHGSAKIGGGALRDQHLVALGRARWPAVLAPIVVLVVALGVPARGMQIWFFRGTSRPDWGTFSDATVNTLAVGALGATAVLAVAFPVALLAVRHPGWVPRLAGRAAYAGHALPGVVVGLALVFFGIRVVPSLYQRLPMLVLAYVVLFLSLGLGALQAAIAQIPPVLDDVARSLGRSPLGVWRAVTVRLAAPGVGAAATLVFLTIMKELPATLFLRPTGFPTLATQLWSHNTAFSRAAAAPYAVAIVALAALPTALLAILGDRGVRARR